MKLGPVCRVFIAWTAILGLLLFKTLCPETFRVPAVVLMISLILYLPYKHWLYNRQGESR